MKNILFLNHTGAVFGSETVLLHTLSTLKKNNSCNLHVIFLKSPDKDFENELQKIGIVNCTSVYYKMIGVSVLKSIIKILLSIFALIKIFLYVKKHKINLIYSNTSVNPYGAWIARLMKLEHIWHFHEEPVKEHLWVHPFFWSSYRSLISYPRNTVVFISNQQKMAWENVLGISIENSALIYNPIKLLHVEDNHTCDYDISFGYLGGFIEHPKNIKRLLNCFKQICRENTNKKLRLILRGKGPLKSWIEEFITLENIADRVILQDYSSNLNSFFSIIDVLVLPSYFESWGLVAIEALYVGKRVIVTKNTAIKELVLVDYCTYIDPYDESTLYAAMKSVLSDPKPHEESVADFRSTVRQVNSSFEYSIQKLINC